MPWPEPRRPRDRRVVSRHARRAETGRPIPSPCGAPTARIPALATILIGSMALTLALLACLPAIALAATPTPSQAAAGDPRSSGQGPGLVGDPLTALVAVAAIAALSIAATLVYVRLTARRHRSDPD